MYIFKIFKNIKKWLGFDEFCRKNLLSSLAELKIIGGPKDLSGKIDENIY